MKRLVLVFWVAALAMSLSCNKEQAQNDTPAAEEGLIPATLDLHVGDTYTFTPELDPARPWYWGSSNPDVAEIDQEGVLTTKSNGSTTVSLTATDTYESWECVVHVTTPVTGIELDITSKDLIMGQSFTLTATVKPATASNKNIIWTSSSPENVSISANKSVCTVNAMQGITKATITAKTEDGEYSAKCTVSVQGAQALYGASTEKSNCYVIYQPGIYVLDLFQGNSSTAVTGVKKADVLWETFGTDESITAGALVTDYFYSECLNKIVFKVPGSNTNPNIVKSGNALIAAKSASGVTLWSWHLWICNGYIPDRNTQPYKNGVVMMDRNLGATGKTGTKGEDRGLLYQWGRKDPFPGFSTGINLAVVTYPAGPMRTAANRTLEYSIAWPKEFICGTSGNEYDWLNESNRTLWTSTKSKYDPCPPGWRVPNGGPTNTSGVWRQSSGASEFYVYCDTNADLSEKFGPSSSTIYYPLSGSYDNSYDTMTPGYYWSCTPADSGRNSYCLKVDRNVSDNHWNNIHTDATVPRSYGCAVRCCKK